MRKENMPDPQKQFLFLFSEPVKKSNSVAVDDSSSAQLEDLNFEDQLRLERALLLRLEKQGF